MIFSLVVAALIMLGGLDHATDIPKYPDGLGKFAAGSLASGIVLAGAFCALVTV